MVLRRRNGPKSWLAHAHWAAATIKTQQTKTKAKPKYRNNARADKNPTKLFSLRLNRISRAVPTMGMCISFYPRIYTCSRPCSERHPLWACAFRWPGRSASQQSHSLHDLRIVCVGLCIGFVNNIKPYFEYVNTSNHINAIQTELTKSNRTNWDRYVVLSGWWS